MSANLEIDDNVFVDDSNIGTDNKNYSMVFLKLVKNDSVTDINWNGSELWVDDIKKGRNIILYNDGTPFALSDAFIKKFTSVISDMMNVSFNQWSPCLEAETDSLRISVLHDSVTNTGISISIRKTPAVRRLNTDMMIDSAYCLKEFNNFMVNAVHAGCNIVVCGLPGVGKTEYVKALTAYIPKEERAITIEDNLEIRYKHINPGKDCVEIKVSPEFSYVDAIKACLRQLPKWIILSEARSTEVESLLESMSTGTHCLTTIHTDDVRKVPDRIMNMSEKVNENHIYSYIDIAIQISKNSATGFWGVSQAAFLSRWNGQNRLEVFYEQDGFVKGSVPEDISIKFKTSNITNPFAETVEDTKK